MPSKVQKDSNKRAMAVKYSDIPEKFRPSMWMDDRVGDWLVLLDGADDNGWILGFCPFHDPQKQTEASAEFNFHLGVMTCHADPKCHAPKRAVSLANVISKIQAGGGV